MDAVLDDAAWQAYLAEASRRAKDMTAPFKMIAERMEQRVRNTFRNQTDPWGIAWEPWKNQGAMEASRQRRGSASIQILLDSGDLYGSIERSHDATSATITAGQSAAQEYAEVHQYGNATTPARAYMPLRTPDDNELPAEWYDAAALPLAEHMLGAFE